MKQAYIEQKQGTSYNDNFQEALDFIAVPLKNKSQQILDAEFSIKLAEEKATVTPYPKATKKKTRKFKERKDIIPLAKPKLLHDELVAKCKLLNIKTVAGMNAFSMSILIKNKESLSRKVKLPQADQVRESDEEVANSTSSLVSGVPLESLISLNYEGKACLSSKLASLEDSSSLLGDETGSSIGIDLVETAPCVKLDNDNLVKVNPEPHPNTAVYGNLAEESLVGLKSLVSKDKISDTISSDSNLVDEDGEHSNHYELTEIDEYQETSPLLSSNHSEEESIWKMFLKRTFGLLISKITKSTIWRQAVGVKMNIQRGVRLMFRKFFR